MTKKQFYIGVYASILIIAISALLSATALYITIHNSNSRQPAEGNTQQKISELQTKFDELKSYVDLIGKNTISLDAMSRASFGSTDTGFQMIYIPYGNLLVKLKNVEKLGDGYKLFFDFGNPTNMALDGLNGTIQWGDKKKDFQILSVLEPGAWNEVPITIGPANEKDIGVVVVGDLKTDTVRMRTVHLPN